MDIDGLFSCTRCGQGFEGADQVLMAVPFQLRGDRVLMGHELLIHEGCGPLRVGMREVGRGRHDEIIAGIRSGPTADGRAPSGRAGRRDVRSLPRFRTTACVHEPRRDRY